MVKIKRKVEMTPKEFLKHLLEQEETEVELDGYTFDYNEEHYSFDPEIKTNEFISYSLHSNTFTVEDKKEITEDTKLSSVLEMYKDIHYPEEIFSTIQKDVCINNIINSNPDFFITKYLYLINEDKPPTLIWKDGELVGDE
ncbi:hypothetical protein [Staphylococcus hominis]